MKNYKATEQTIHRIDAVERMINSVKPGTWAYSYWVNVHTRLVRSLRLSAVE